MPESAPANLRRWALDIGELGKDLAALGDHGQFAARLAAMAPTWKISPKESVLLQDDQVRAMFVVLVQDLVRELGQLARVPTFWCAAQGEGEQLGYEMQGLHCSGRVDARIELCRFGGALDVGNRASVIETATVARAKQCWHKDLRGALRVAARRSQRFAQQGPAGLKRSGYAVYDQAKRLESAMTLLLSDEQLAATRADLATDWLQGIDLWVHAPWVAPSKGCGVSVSLVRQGAALQRKQDKGPPLWSPGSLGTQLLAQLQANKDPQHKRAKAAWQALGQPIQVADATAALARRLDAMARAYQHPVLSLGAQLSLWLRGQARQMLSVR